MDNWFDLYRIVIEIRVSALRMRGKFQLYPDIRHLTPTPDTRHLTPDT